MWVKRSRNNYAYAEERGPRDEANIHVHVHVVEHVVMGIIRKTKECLFLPATVGGGGGGVL